MRTKGGVKTHRRHKRVLNDAKGYRGARSRSFTVAKETLDRAMAYAFSGRKLKKRDYRSLWIARINAALRPHGISYSRFISALGQLKIELDRRVLADMAFHGTKSFVEVAKLAIGVENKRKEELAKTQPKQASKKLAA
jgi:large subunit ribosomal protein L20